MIENIALKNKGAIWYHTKSWYGPSLSKSSLGKFFFEVLSSGAQVGQIWVLNHQYRNSAIMVSVFMTENMKNDIESRTDYRFEIPGQICLN
jgi:hypothetical protein